MADTQQPVFARRRIKRFAVMQLGLVHSAYCGMLGGVVSLFLLFNLAFRFTGAPPAPIATALGIGFALILPALYAVLGLLVGIVSAWVYNLAARWIGGIEVEVE